jgi:hypothetical protein
MVQLLYQLAILDWVRFMAGWGVWGNYDWAISKATEIVSELANRVSAMRALSNAQDGDGTAADAGYEFAVALDSLCPL